MDNLHTARVAHDLKNLIINFDLMMNFLASMVVDETEEVREIKQLTGILYKQGMMLTMQLLNEGDFTNESCILNRLLEDITRVYGFVAERKNISLNLSLPAGEMRSNISYYEIHRLLDNLLNNAIKFTYPGGKVEISMEQSGNTAQVTIKDSGIGIPAAGGHLSDIQPAKRPGTANEISYGMGLNIVHEMAEKNKIDVWYETSEENGTSFYLKIPLIN